MSQWTSTDEGLLCPMCGSKTMITEMHDYGGYEGGSSDCTACGYFIIANAGNGSWEEADWSANRKDGVNVAGKNAEDGSTDTWHMFPGSRVGAKAEAADNKDKWFVFVTESTVEIISGDPAQWMSNVENIQKVRDFLNSIQLIKKEIAA